jgi:capsular polysaccharide transport system permease protein
MAQSLHSHTVRVVSASEIDGVRPRRRGVLARFLRSLNIWFWAIVGVPTLIAGVYFFGLASDLYLSEVKFIVHTPSNTASNSQLAGVLSGVAGLNNSTSDAYAVQEYMMSRDVVRQLDQHDNLRAVLDRPGADIVSRFPGLFSWRNDFEALYKAYSRFVSVDMNSTTGITSLEVKAYRPGDAELLASRLLSYGEELVNELNERARKDSIQAFTDEVGELKRQIAAVRTQMTAYRVNEQFLDPHSAATGPVALLANLNAQQANAKRELDELLRDAPANAQIPLLRTRVATLDKLIWDQQQQITGRSNSVAAKQAEYERLSVDVSLLEKQLDAALGSLQTAKLDAQRQQFYLEVIAAPNLPDYPLYPKRTLSFAIVLVSCLIAYGIAWLLVASVREHAAA